VSCLISSDSADRVLRDEFDKVRHPVSDAPIPQPDERQLHASSASPITQRLRLDAENLRGLFLIEQLRGFLFHNRHK
jgi:hypothetical protein